MVDVDTQLLRAGPLSPQQVQGGLTVLSSDECAALGGTMNSTLGRTTQSKYYEYYDNSTGPGYYQL